MSRLPAKIEKWFRRYKISTFAIYNSVFGPFKCKLRYEFVAVVSYKCGNFILRISEDVNLRVVDFYDQNSKSEKI